MQAFDDDWPLGLVNLNRCQPPPPHQGCVDGAQMPALCSSKNVDDGAGPTY